MAQNYQHQDWYRRWHRKHEALIFLWGLIFNEWCTGMTNERALSLPEAASAMNPVGNHEPMPVSQRQPFLRCLWPLPKTFAVTSTLFAAMTLHDEQPLLQTRTENECKACTIKDYPKCSFLLSPDPVSLCSKSSHARQEFVWKRILLNTRVGNALQWRGCAKICHKQTDQSGAHIKAMPCANGLMWDVLPTTCVATLSNPQQ